MTTTRPRFARTHADELIVHCNGVNHRDYGQRGMCLTCGHDVVRREDKRIFDIVNYYTEYGNAKTAIMCYHGSHECNADSVRAFKLEHDEALAAGKIVHDQIVTVIRGRKVPKGTTGTIFYRVMAHDFKGNDIVKIGIKTAEGDTHFVNAAYVIAVEQPSHTVELKCTKCGEAGIVHHYDCTGSEIVADAPAPAAPARRTGSHAECTHEPTKAARAACRKARQG